MDGFDPTDPTLGPGPEVYQYWGCIWSPDATAPDGWGVTTPAVEIAAPCIAYAAVLLAAREAVDLADDEILAVGCAVVADPAPTCFLTAAQVRLAQHLLKEAP